MQTLRTNKMETVPVIKLLLSLSLPIMFSMMIQALYNVVDPIFIARFSEKALSAIALTFPVQTLMIALGVGTCVGVNAFLSRTLGEKNIEKARSISQHGVLLALFSYFISLVVGLFLTHKFFAIQTVDSQIVEYGTDYMSICFTFSLFMPVYGLTSGILPIMAYNLGAKKRERVMDTLRCAITYMAVIMLTGTAIFQLFPSQLLNFFHVSDEMYLIGVPALRIISSYFIFEGFCLVSQTSFQAFGKGITSLICSVTRQIIVLFPVAYMLSLSGNINYVWIAYPITGIVSLVVCLLLWRCVWKTSENLNVKC